MLAETLGILQARRGYAFMRRVFDWLVMLPHMQFLDDSDWKDIDAMHQNYGPKLSWVDAAVVSRCRNKGWKPLCFDLALERATKT